MYKNRNYIELEIPKMFKAVRNVKANLIKLKKCLKIYQNINIIISIFASTNYFSL